MLIIVKIQNINLLNSYIYININETRQNLYMKFILAINNFQKVVILVNNTR